jgi:hypothetical protein
MAVPATIESLTQFFGGTAAVWNNIATPVPDKMIVIALDTGDIKRGNGIALYSDLPILFNVNDIINIQASLAQKAPIVHQHPLNDLPQVVSALGQKSDVGHTHSLAQLPEVQTALALKADTTAVNSALAQKANTTDVATSLSGKMDIGSPVSMSQLPQAVVDVATIGGTINNRQYFVGSF